MEGKKPSIYIIYLVYIPGAIYRDFNIEAFRYHIQRPFHTPGDTYAACHATVVSISPRNTLVPTRPTRHTLYRTALVGYPPAHLFSRLFPAQGLFQRPHLVVDEVQHQNQVETSKVLNSSPEVLPGDLSTSKTLCFMTIKIVQCNNN